MKVGHFYGGVLIVLGNRLCQPFRVWPEAISKAVDVPLHSWKACGKPQCGSQVISESEGQINVFL